MDDYPRREIETLQHLHRGLLVEIEKAEFQEHRLVQRIGKAEAVGDAYQAISFRADLLDIMKELDALRGEVLRVQDRLKELEGANDGDSAGRA